MGAGSQGPDPKRTNKSYEGQAPIADKGGWVRGSPLALPRKEILRRMREDTRRGRR